jgi:hypothetical protein
LTARLPAIQIPVKSGCPSAARGVAAAVGDPCGPLLQDVAKAATTTRRNAHAAVRAIACREHVMTIAVRS